MTKWSQGGDAADAGAVTMCAGGVLATTPQAKEAVVRSSIPVGGSTTVSQNAPATGVRGVMFQGEPGFPGLLTWPESDWTIQLNVTTANADWTWTGTRVCRVSASNAPKVTVGEATRQHFNLGATGVLTMSVYGDETVVLTSDEVYIVLYFDVSGSATPSSFAFQPDQGIVANRLPIVEVVNETVTVTETVKEKNDSDMDPDFEETVTVTETVFALRVPLVRAVNETLTTSEAVVSIVGKFAVVNESVSVTEAAPVTVVTLIGTGSAKGLAVMTGVTRGMTGVAGAAKGDVGVAGVAKGMVVAATATGSGVSA